MGSYLPGTGTWAEWFGIGLGSFAPEVSLPTFIHHTWVWDRLFRISTSLPLLPIWMGVISFNSLVVGLSYSCIFWQFWVIVVLWFSCNVCCGCVRSHVYLHSHLVIFWVRTPRACSIQPRWPFPFLHQNLGVRLTLVSRVCVGRCEAAGLRVAGAGGGVGERCVEARLVWASWLRELVFDFPKAGFDGHPCTHVFVQLV